MASATRDGLTTADRQIIGDVFTSDRPYQLLLRLCDECGNRSAGSPSERMAADVIAEHPIALQLRNLQTMAEISIEKNSTIIFPAQFMTTVQEAIQMLKKDSAKG